MNDDSKNQSIDRVAVDLFSGCGGMSAGFKAAGYNLRAAVDAELSKPSAKQGSTGCNATYLRNIGTQPRLADIATLDPRVIAESLPSGRCDVLLACPPCTDYTRTKPSNHLVDGSRNGLTGRVADFAAVLAPRHIFMENAREFLNGRFSYHARDLFTSLERLGYRIEAHVHVLSRFGLPQARERALVVATKSVRPLSLEHLWAGLRLSAAPSVRTALSRIPKAPDPDAKAPGIGEALSARLSAIPPDGGSWAALCASEDSRRHLTPSMQRRFSSGEMGSHPDAYGRMAWDRPAPTIKRECAHPGNGRYVHPIENRIMTIREMATLQGFPTTWQFEGSVTGRYRQIGDAVPPMISWQLALLARWMDDGQRPAANDIAMPGTCLRPEDMIAA